jgi:putative ABC transport system ATP-binding protein
MAEAMGGLNPAPALQADPRGAASPFSIFAQGVHHRYKTGSTWVRALDSIDLAVPKAGLAALVGPSGCGKTTLLNLLGGLDKPASGSIIVDGVEVTSLSGSRLNAYRSRTVSFIFQFFNLLPNLTAAENIALGLEACGITGGQAQERIERHLKNVGLAEKAQRYPSELSGGEQQRVAIARALARETGVILADEPTGNLDQASATSILDLLCGLAETGTTSIFMITHDPRSAERAHFRYSMRDGRIAEKGAGWRR